MLFYWGLLLDPHGIYTALWEWSHYHKNNCVMEPQALMDNMEYALTCWENGAKDKTLLYRCAVRTWVLVHAFCPT